MRANAVVEAAARFLNAVHDAHVRRRDGAPLSEDVEQAVEEELGAEITQSIS